MFPGQHPWTPCLAHSLWEYTYSVSESNSELNQLHVSEAAEAAGTITTIEDEQHINHDITENMRDSNVIFPQPSSCSMCIRYIYRKLFRKYS